MNATHVNIVVLSCVPLSNMSVFYVGKSLCFISVLLLFMLFVLSLMPSGYIYRYFIICKALCDLRVYLV